MKTEINRYLAVIDDEDYVINLAGSYDYLELPYYISQDMEDADLRIHPTGKEMLDAYVTPLFLEKARLAGLAVPDYYLSNGYFEPPVIIDPINPFMSHSKTVLKPGHRDAIAKSMTRNFTYAICCQEIPPGARIKRFRSVLGWCAMTRFRPASRAIWNYFRIPLAVVRVIIPPDGTILYSDISQLSIDQLNVRERKYLESGVRWVD